MKGQGAHSRIKHDEVRKLARGQVAIAARVLDKSARIALIDLLAGDGEGVPDDPSMLPGIEFESSATPTTLIRCADDLAAKGFATRVVLCEKNRALRKKLQARFGADPRVVILKNCRECLRLPADRYDYSVVIADPNGSRVHTENLDVLQHLSRVIPKVDFLIIVNESAIYRHHGLRPPEEQQYANVRGSAAARERHLWQLSGLNWARALNRLQVYISRFRFGTRGMQGRIFLVTNYAQRKPANFDHVVDATPTMAATRSAPPTSAEPADLFARGDRRADPRSASR